MACMGPTYDQERYDEIAEEVLDYIKEKYKVLNRHKEALPRPLSRSREMAEYKLKDAVADLIWQHDCESF